MRETSQSELSQGPQIFDRGLLRGRGRRAVAAGPETFLLDRVAADLSERLGAVLRRFDLVLDLGTPGDALRAALAGVPSVGSAIAARATPPESNARATAFVVADEEALPFRSAAFDIVVSAL